MYLHETKLKKEDKHFIQIYSFNLCFQVFSFKCFSLNLFKPNGIERRGHRFYSKLFKNLFEFCIQKTELEKEVVDFLRYHIHCE